MIDEQLGPERRLQFLKEPVRHWRAGKAELAHRTSISFCKGRVVHEIVIERRHQIQIGHALGRDQSQGFGRVEPAQANKSAADKRHCQQRADTHRMVKRHDAERALAAAVKVLRDMRHSGGRSARCRRGTPFGRAVVPEV